MLNRRDFLKVGSLLSAGAAIRTVVPWMDVVQRIDSDKPNIIILLFDAMSARNLSLYGYGRPTSPNLERFAERATVYHSHTSAGNFTTPGTASLLTGLYPWTHRAINHQGQVRRSLTDLNIFRLLGDSYYKAGYAQNMWANLIVDQFRDAINLHLLPNTFLERYRALVASEFLNNDPIAAYYAFESFMGMGRQSANPMPGSLSFGFLDGVYSSMQAGDDRTEKYPKGYPGNLHTFFDLTDLLVSAGEFLIGLASQSKPFMAYMHFFPPHEPYRASSEFIDLFANDGFEPPFKPRHKLSLSRHNKKDLQPLRKDYDEYIASLDFELGALFDQLDRSGLLDTSYVIVTSDHGHFFERGEHGHGSRLMFEPVIHVPLLISTPGQRERVDVRVPTSSVDVAPTILKLAGQPVPGELEGQLLPGLGGAENAARSLFSMVASTDSAFLPLQKCTLSITRGAYKLIHYIGYPGYDRISELYNLQEDPEEKKDLMARDPKTGQDLEQELLDALEESNRRVSTVQLE